MILIIFFLNLVNEVMLHHVSMEIPKDVFLFDINFDGGDRVLKTSMMSFNCVCMNILGFKVNKLFRVIDPKVIILLLGWKS